MRAGMCVYVRGGGGGEGGGPSAWGWGGGGEGWGWWGGDYNSPLTIGPLSQSSLHFAEPV